MEFFDKKSRRNLPRYCSLVILDLVKVRVFVMPKASVLDPQGAAVEHAFESLGYCKGKEVRIGKVVEFELEEGEEADIDRVCHELLSNPVIEDYRYEVL